MLLMKLTNARKFWKTFGSISIANDRLVRQSLPEKILKPDGVLSANKVEYMQVWMDHFKTLFNPPDIGLGLRQFDREETGRNFIGQEILSSPITIEEVETAVNSPHDKICPSVMKCDKILLYLVSLFQYCFTNSTVPKSWQTSIIQPIFKGSGHRNDPSTYRGITIQSCITKVFCKVLNNRLRNYLEVNEIIKDEQNGFRKDRSCQDHVSSLYFLLENRKLNKLDTYACFVDFRKAFDSVTRELLWQKMAANGINGKYLDCIQALCTNMTSSVRINDDFSPPFSINRGVKQGCPLSPTLFNIFIND